MIYIIDHKDSFTHNVVHQFSLFDNVQCDDFSRINKSKLNHFTFHLSNPINIFIRNKILKYLSKNKKFLENYLGKIYRA